MGTMVVIRPGVWHHAGFCSSPSPVRFLVILPERTYSYDSVVSRVSEHDRVLLLPSRS
jgi:hypothetical protein